MFDLLIKNAQVVNGLGTSAFNADIAVKDGVIVEIGTIHQPAAETIDAGGRVAAPAFFAEDFDGAV